MKILSGFKSKCEKGEDVFDLGDARGKYAHHAPEGYFAAIQKSAWIGNRITVVWGNDDLDSETVVELVPLLTYSDDEAETGLGKATKATTRSGQIHSQAIQPDLSSRLRLRP